MLCEQHSKQDILKNNFQLIQYISIDFFCPLELCWYKCGNNCMKHKPEASVCVSALLSSGLLVFNIC